MQIGVRLNGDSKLTVGVKVSVNSCLSLYLGPAIPHLSPKLDWLFPPRPSNDKQYWWMDGVFSFNLKDGGEDPDYYSAGELRNQYCVFKKALFKNNLLPPWGPEALRSSASGTTVWAWRWLYIPTPECRLWSSEHPEASRSSEVQLRGHKPHTVNLMLHNCLLIATVQRFHNKSTSRPSRQLLH